MIFFKKEAKQNAKSEVAQQAADSQIFGDAGIRELTECEFVQVSGGESAGGVVTVNL